MLPKVRQGFLVALGLVLVALVVWCGVLLVKSFWESFIQLNPAVATGIVAGAVTVLVSVISVLFSKHFEQRNNILKELREKKVPVYEELIELIFRIAYREKLGEAT